MSCKETLPAKENRSLNNNTSKIKCTSKKKKINRSIRGSETFDNTMAPFQNARQKCIEHNLSLLFIER